MINIAKEHQSIKLCWEDFIKNGQLGSGYVRPEIELSWQRCRNAQVDPYGKGSGLLLSEEELIVLKHKQKDLIKISKPFMENLYKFVVGTGFVVILADEQGYIMEMLGDRDTLKDALKINLVPGSCWLEEQGGTNGIGTASILRKPVQINGEEHFCRPVQLWTCSACPIWDERGNMIGVLQMSGPSYATHLHTLGMVVAAAKAIGEQLRVESKNRQLTLANNRISNIYNNMSDGVIIFNSEGISTQVNPAAERILHTSAKQLLEKDIGALFKGKCNSQISDLLKNGKGFSDFEVFFEFDHRYRSCLVSGNIVHDNKENISGGILIIKSLNKVKNLVNQISGAQANFRFSDILGNSKEIQEAVRIATMAAESDSNVLLLGESGTGKEIFAQAIHNLSFRKNGPFVALNCGAIPRELIGSELFGYVDGAFTGAKKGGRPGKFELAGGGTLFLDEIGDMNLGKQASLLRAIQERKIVRIGGDKVIPIDVRIISATNKNLQEQVELGNFRRDLFYRLNVISVSLPPLRRRLDDIPLLFNHFLRQECQRIGKKIDKIDPAIIPTLQNYHWPGNIRELQNIAERMACIVLDGKLYLEDLPQEILERERKESLPVRNKKSVVIDIDRERERHKEKIEAQEKEEITNLLIECGGNISQAAKKMGVSRNTMYRKINAYGLKNK
ncbi:MAG: sigma-54-dependent Fis family transcriptional regulator [Bacillota bacterium]|jgi:transcriptional regulator of acetoin/glycerol metabolism